MHALCQHLGDYIAKIHSPFLSFSLQYQPVFATDHLSFLIVDSEEGRVLSFALIFPTMWKWIVYYRHRQIDCKKNQSLEF